MLDRVHYITNQVTSKLHHNTSALTHSEIRVGLKIRVGTDATLKNHMRMFPSVLMSRSILS
jgi:hypothetical protein